jgi:alpha-L-fucosidase 2
VDSNYRARIGAARDQLAGPRIGKWGQLQEWMVDRDDPNDDHRHTSHLFAVYPGAQVTAASTPDWAAGAATSLKARGTTGNSRRQWAWAWRTALWARLRDAERAHDMLRGLLTHNTCLNLFGLHPPMQVDGNFGITAGICEMLLQSQGGEIEILPALPKAWPDGRVTGLRARGGSTVDIEWKDGEVASYRVRSPRSEPVKVRVNGEVVALQPETP